MEKPIHVCIVGGGLAGLALAIALAKEELQMQQEASIKSPASELFQISVLEKRDFSSRGATLGLARNGQAALGEICPDLLAELQRIGVSIPSTGGYMLPWYRVRDGLLDRAKQYRNVEILTHVEIQSIHDSQEEQEQEPPVRVEFQQRKIPDSVETSTREFDLLVGADGVHSYVRHHLGAPPAVSSQTLCWRGALNGLPEELMHLTKLPVGKFYPTEKGFFSIFNFDPAIQQFISWVCTSKDLAAKNALDTIYGIENDQDSQDAKRLLEASTEEERQFFTILSTIDMKEDVGWGGKGNITLVGDAAHALRPASGLGGSLALEDAVILVREIVAGQRLNNTTGSSNSNYVSQALRSFEEKRFVRCKTIVDDQTRIAEAGYDKQSSADKYKWTSEFREWVFCGPDAAPHPPAKMYVT